VYFKNCRTCWTLFVLSFRLWKYRFRTLLVLKWGFSITSIYQPTNAHIISHKTLLKHFKTLRHVSILSDHHQGALFLAKIMLQYSQFNSYLQTGCCGSISCCIGMCCGAVARCGIRSTPSHCSTTHSYTTWYAATTPRLQIRIELWIL